VTNGSATSREPETPERLWRVPVYLPYLQPPLTEQAVREAETRLGVRLPQAYVAALRVQNGGYLRLHDHPAGYPQVEYLEGIGPREPSLSLWRGWDEIKSYMEEEGITTPARIDDLLPFFGDGHFHYCLDYRESGRAGEPCVTYVDVETFDIDEVLAPDFGTFLGQLRPGESYEVHGLVTNDDAEVVLAALAEGTGLSFEDRGDQNNGYRWFAVRLPGDAGWITLTANRVRRGFVRKSDSEHAVLSRMLPEWVHRFPEHHDCGFFLSCSDKDEAREAFARLLTKLPFATRTVVLER
jgi:hypothetical protein